MTDHPTERPIDQLTKVCIEKSKSKSPRQLTRISRPDRPPDRPKSYKKNHKYKSPVNLPSSPVRLPSPRRLTLLPVDLPSSPSTYPLPRQLTLLPVDLPSTPSGYPLPRQLTRIYFPVRLPGFLSPSTYPDFPPSAYPPHPISPKTPSITTPLESPSKILPNPPKRNEKIKKYFIQTPTFPDHLPSRADRSPSRSFFLVGFHFIAYYLFLSNGP